MEESQTASVSQLDMNEQITSLQQEIQDLKDSLKDEIEDRQNIKDSITRKEQILTELQDKACQSCQDVLKELKYKRKR